MPVFRLIKDVHPFAPGNRHGWGMAAEKRREAGYHRLRPVWLPRHRSGSSHRGIGHRGYRRKAVHRRREQGEGRGQALLVVQRDASGRKSVASYW